MKGGDALCVLAFCITQRKEVAMSSMESLAQYHQQALPLIVERMGTVFSGVPVDIEGGKHIRGVLALLVSDALGGEREKALDYAAVVLSVSVSNSTFAFGTNPLNTWLTPDTSVLVNDGNVAEDFLGKISQFTDGSNTWGISTISNGADIIRAQWSITSETGPWTDISAYDTDFTIETNVAVSDSVTLWFRIQTPVKCSNRRSSIFFFLKNRADI